MDNNTRTRAATYQVVANTEHQYSIWPVDLGLPSGWKTIGEASSKEDCLAYIEENWIDLRPLSQRTP
jgi:MbtH protein